MIYGVGIQVADVHDMVCRVCDVHGRDRAVDLGEAVFGLGCGRLVGGPGELRASA